MAVRELRLEGHEGAELRCVLRDEGADGVGVIFPGEHVSPDWGALFWARRLLERRGLAVLEVWWDYQRLPANVPDELLAEWIGDDARTVLAAVEDYEPLVLVGKSLGTIGLAELFRSTDIAGAPSIWLTPLLRIAAVRGAVGSLDGPALVVYGTADRAADGGIVGDGRREVLELDGVDHALEVDDPVASVDVLRRVVETMDAFLTRALGAAS